MPSNVLLVCGCRDWTDAALIEKSVADIKESMWLTRQVTVTVIHGGAIGADTLATTAAWKLGLEVFIYPAEWKQHGKAAGPIRNQQMIDLGKPSNALAFWDGKSRGTLDMIKRLAVSRIPVVIIPKGFIPNAL